MAVAAAAVPAVAVAVAVAVEVAVARIQITINNHRAGSLSGTDETVASLSPVLVEIRKGRGGTVTGVTCRLILGTAGMTWTAGDLYDRSVENIVLKGKVFIFF